MHCSIELGHWAVELHTKTLPRGSGQWNSCHALPHSLGALGSGTLATHCYTAWGIEQWNSCITPAHYLGAAGDGNCATHCCTLWGYRAVELRQYTDTLPHTATLRTPTGTRTPTAYCCVAKGLWAVELLHYTTAAPGRKGLCAPHDVIARGTGE